MSGRLDELRRRLAEYEDDRSADKELRLAAALVNSAPALLDVVEEARRHSCYMHGVGEGPPGDRGTECRMCAALARLDEGTAG